ncbi:MAG: class I SAM-dependent methyltransferase [Chloroflexi bacterium]|nr:class I SAM-dependent methyltransferase [Chloroflexota bacterium]
MKPSQSSLTAEGIAFARAFESRKPPGERVCFDPYARFFVSPWLGFISRLFMSYAQRRSPGVFDFLVVRARTIDDYLQACLEAGLEQLVILGAGFDSRPYRFDALKQGIKVFEVDHPATQRIKLEKLTKIFGKLPPHVAYASVDFATQSLEQRLKESGYDPGLKTLFIWEGVTQYLPPAAIDATLAFIAENSAPGSSVIFDYLYTSTLSTEGKHKEIRSMRRYERLTGERITFGIPEGTIREFLEQRGFCQVVNAGPEELKKAYLTGPNEKRKVASGYAIAHAMVPGD